MQNYVRNLIDFDNSVVGHLGNFNKIEQLLAKGDNVVLLANHQTEADPGGKRLLLTSNKTTGQTICCQTECQWGSNAWYAGLLRRDNLSCQALFLEYLSVNFRSRKRRENSIEGWYNQLCKTLTHIPDAEPLEMCLYLREVWLRSCLGTYASEQASALGYRCALCCWR